MHADAARMQATFPSYPTMAWTLAAPVFLFAIIFAAVTILGQPNEHLRAAALISVILPVFIGSAAWLATRPAYNVRYDRIAGLLVLVQTWPVRRTIFSVKSSSIVAIDVRNANTDDSLAYAVIARLADSSEVTLSAEIVSRKKAELLCEALRKTLAL